MVDVEHGQRQGRGVGFGGGAGALQLLVEGLAVGEVGEAVGGGVAADLLQMVAQAVHLGGGLLQLRFKGPVLFLHALGGGGEGLHDAVHVLGRIGRGELAGDGGEGLAVMGARPLGGVHRLCDRRQLVAQLVAGVANLVVQLCLGQEGRRQFLRDVLGDLLAGAQQALDLLAERALGVAHEMQPELEVERRRPDVVGLHDLDGLTGDLIGLRSSQRALDLAGHQDSLAAYRASPRRSNRPGNLGRRVETAG